MNVATSCCTVPLHQTSAETSVLKVLTAMLNSSKLDKCWRWVRSITEINTQQHNRYDMSYTYSALVVSSTATPSQFRIIELSLSSSYSIPLLKYLINLLSTASVH